jgi:DeoR family transcriptional regulator, suf operon transcriptional repressor
MQETRQQILTILKEKGQATVDALAVSLDLTPITVRHHLSILLGEGYLTAQQVRRKVGRPHYVYSLTDKASDLFPQGYHLLTDRLLEELKVMVGADGTQVLLSRLADKLAASIGPQIGGETVEERLDQAARLLVAEGFLARWEKTPDGYTFYELNCPYRRVIEHHPEVCAMDQRFLSAVLRISVQKIDCIVEGGERCSYRVHTNPPQTRQLTTTT